MKRGRKAFSGIKKEGCRERKADFTVVAVSFLNGVAMTTVYQRVRRQQSVRATPPASACL